MEVESVVLLVIACCLPAFAITHWILGGDDDA